MDPAKPFPELVRALTDERVLHALMEQRRLTRAELAALIGISKPTAGESVRRLTEAGLIADTGERTPGGRGRGRVGSYYALAADVGVALAVSIAPEGVVAEAVDAYGDVVGRSEREISRPARPAQVTAAVRSAAAEVGAAVAVAPRLAVVSAADPVDRTTGQLVHLPGSPFLVGDLDPVEALAPHVTGPIVVDNDVNWAAQAEAMRTGASLDDFAYLYLGEGLGCGIVSDGAVRRGATGLAGEIAHVVTVGPRSRAMTFMQVFADLGLHRHGTTAIDVDRLLTATNQPQARPPSAEAGRKAAATEEDAKPEAVRAVLGHAVSGVIAAVVALTDPGTVIVGGRWGSEPIILDAIRTASAEGPRQVPIRAASVTVEAPLAGARRYAVARLRSAIVAAARPATPAG